MMEAEESPVDGPVPSPSHSADFEVVTSMADFAYDADYKLGIQELCPVCGDKVSGYHYGLQTCESCKGFFKRTVQNKKVYSCVDNQECLIDKAQRKRCPYCRFQKCLGVGMRLEAVRADRMRGGRNKFGPMYKRDRALKQQALRQHQHFLPHMPCDIYLNAPTPSHAASMSSFGNMVPTMRDNNGGGVGCTGDMTPPDIKPDVNFLNMMNAAAAAAGTTTTMPTSCSSHQVTTAAAAAAAAQRLCGEMALPQNNHINLNLCNGGGVSVPSHMMSNCGYSSSSLHPAATRPPPPPPPLAPDNGMMAPYAAPPYHIPPPPSRTPPTSRTPPVGAASLIHELCRREPDEADTIHKMTAITEVTLRRDNGTLARQLRSCDTMTIDSDATASALLLLLSDICDQSLFILVEWARTAYFFNSLKVEDQMKLLQNSWSELLILDFVHRLTKQQPNFDSLMLVTGHCVRLTWLNKIGLGEICKCMLELVKQLRNVQLDTNEYICLRYLILLNPDVAGLCNKALVKDSQSRVNATLLEYVSWRRTAQMSDRFGALLVQLPAVRLVSIACEDYLAARRAAADLPDNTLLVEMLNSKR